MNCEDEEYAALVRERYSRLYSAIIKIWNLVYRSSSRVYASNEGEYINATMEVLKALKAWWYV